MPPTGIIAEKYKRWILTVGCMQPPTQIVAERYKKPRADSLMVIFYQNGGEKEKLGASVQLSSQV